MSEKAEHTPTPWQIEYRKIVDCVPSSGYNFNKVIAHPGHPDDWDANAEFIVRAVNAYEKNQATIKALVELLWRNLDRMKLINGSDDRCLVSPLECLNHGLIRETEDALAQADAEAK